MVPESVLSFVAFLVVVAPGLLFEMLRERRRPALEETAFREAGRIALASLAFSGVAVCVLALVRTLHAAWMPDPRAWIAGSGKYVATHYRLVFTAVLLEVLLALGFAVLLDRTWRRHATGEVVAGGIWYQLLRAERPSGTSAWVSLCLQDGTQIGGFVGYYTTGEKLADRELALEHNVHGTGMKLLAPTKDALPERLDGWNHVIVRGDQIRYWKLEYRAGTGAAPVSAPATDGTGTQSGPAVDGATPAVPTDAAQARR